MAHARTVGDVSREPPRRVIRTGVMPGSVIHAGSFRSHGGPVLDGLRHLRINHRGCLSVGKRDHTNATDSSK